jgi:hypothetical protein
MDFHDIRTVISIDRILYQYEISTQKMRKLFFGLNTEWESFDCRDINKTIIHICGRQIFLSIHLNVLSQPMGKLDTPQDDSPFFSIVVDFLSRFETSARIGRYGPVVK